MTEAGDRRALTISALVDAKLNAFLCSTSTEVLLVVGHWPVMSSSVDIHTADGEVRLIVPEDEVDLAEKTSSAKLIAYKPAVLDTLRTPLERLRAPLQDALEELGLIEGTIGLQLGEGVQPSSYAVSYQFRSSLQNLFHQLMPHDSLKLCDGVLDSSKAIKTSGELALLENACQVSPANFFCMSGPNSRCARPIMQAQVRALVPYGPEWLAAMSTGLPQHDERARPQ